MFSRGAVRVGLRVDAGERAGVQTGSRRYVVVHLSRSGRRICITSTLLAVYRPLLSQLPVVGNFNAKRLNRRNSNSRK